MRYGAALRQLVTVSEAATDDLRLRDTDIGYPLEELWVGGDVLEGPQELDATCVVLVLDQPVAEVTWLALNPAGQWIAERLRMTRLPMRWYCRPGRVPGLESRAAQGVAVLVGGDSAGSRGDREPAAAPVRLTSPCPPFRRPAHGSAGDRGGRLPSPPAARTGSLLGRVVAPRAPRLRHPARGSPVASLRGGPGDRGRHSSDQRAVTIRRRRRRLRGRGPSTGAPRHSSRKSLSTGTPPRSVFSTTQ